jgi:hypothetical protein
VFYQRPQHGGFENLARLLTVTSFDTDLLSTIYGPLFRRQEIPSLHEARRDNVLMYVGHTRRSFLPRALVWRMYVEQGDYEIQVDRFQVPTNPFNTTDTL